TAGALLFTPQASYLLTDFRYMTQAPAQAVDYKVVEHAPDMLETVAALLAQENVKRVGFEELHVTYAEYQAWAKALAPVELVPLGGLIEALRMVKDEDEIAVMREAAAVADAAFQHALACMREGVTEIEIAA